MPIIILPPHAEHFWNTPKDWSDNFFPGSNPFTDLLAEIDRADAASETAINDVRQRFLSLVPAVPAIQQLAEAYINAHFDSALLVKKGLITAAKAGISGVKPVLRPVYVAKGACPINQHLDSTVNLLNDIIEYDPKDVLSLDQSLTITFNLPPVGGIEFPLPMKWKHGFTVVHEKLGDKVDRQPIDHHTTDLFKERVDTTHAYTLKYEAEFQLGPFTGSIDDMWVATQVASSEWCS